LTYPSGQTITVRDGGIGLSDSGAKYPLVVGSCSSGTANTLYFATNQNSLRDTLGHGKAVELALPCITAQGGVLVLKTATSTAGAAGAVTKTAVAGGTGTGTVTVAGAAYDDFQVKVRIKSTGTVGTGRFDYSLDASGDSPTYSEELTIPSGTTYVIPGTNLTLTFVVGGGPVFFASGDSHTFACTAPQYTTSDLGTAWTALLAALGSYRISKVFFTGRSASASAAATMEAAVATHMASLESRKRWARAMMDAGNDTAANVISSFAAVSNSRVALAFGQADVTTLNPHAGYGTPRQSAAFVLSERAAQADLSENLGRVASGSLRCSKITADEGVTQSFIESHKINTLRTYDGQAGFYSTNGYLKSASGSDFIYWDWGTVLDEICSTVYDAQQPWLLRKVRVLSDGTGRIDPRDAVRIEAAVRAALKAKITDPKNAEGFNGHVSDIEYVVDLTNDVLRTRQLKSTVRAVPLAPLESIATEIGFTGSIGNPATEGEAAA
jgi:hypothetical protein